MDELERLLSAAGHRWRNMQPEPSPLLEMVETSATPLHRAPVRNRALPFLAAAVVMIAIVGSVVAVRHVLGGSMAAQSSAMGRGTATYLGEVPWNNAVANRPGARAITIEVNTSLAAVDACAVSALRTEVFRAHGVVNVRVAAYGHKLKSHQICAEPGRPPRSLSIKTPFAMNGHIIRDTYDGSRHQVLYASDVPRPTKPLPPGYDAWSTMWSEDESITTQQSLDRACPGMCRIRLYSAPGSVAVDSVGESLGGTITRAPMGGGVTATLSVARSSAAGIVQRIVRWRRADGTTFELVAQGTEGHVPSLSQLLAIARSVP